MDVFHFALQYIAEHGDELKKTVKFLCVRIFMDPIHERKISFMEVLGYCFIGTQHELLDQAFRYRPFAKHHFLRLAIIIDDNTGFTEIEVNSTSVKSALAQNFGQFAHSIKNGISGS